MNGVKLEAKNKRIGILKEIDAIEAIHCKPCPISKMTTYEKAGKHLCEGCEHFGKINALGVDLLSTSNASKAVPEVLNKSAYALLKDRDWTDKEIQSHYGIDNNDFIFFISQNDIRRRKSTSRDELVGVKKRIEFDVNAYTEWVMQGKKDYAFCEYYGLSISALKVHKKKFGVKKSDIPKPPKPKRVRKRTAKVEIDPQPIQSKSEGTPLAKITVDVYESHRERKMKDKDIAALHNISMATLYQFKSKNGLSNKRKLADPAPVEAVEPIALVEPKEMPSIESDWKPEVVVDTILPELAEKVLPDTLIIEQQYEIEKLQREAELWKSRQKDTERKFFDLSGDYRELDVDYRNLKTYCQKIEKENSELKETVTLNHLLMKQQVRFLDRLDDLVSNPTEAAEFVWR